MKKLFCKLIAIVALLSFSFAAPVGAVGIELPIEQDITPSGLFSGQRHSYSVIFRGNGEALTFAKIVFTNSTESDMTKFNFEIPGVKPSEIEMYQMELKHRCLAYDSVNKYTENDLSDDVCTQWEEGNYDNEYYSNYYGNDNQATYSKIKGTNLSQHGSKFSITLPVAVKSNKTSALVIAYAAKGYVTESSGLFKFNFETIKVNSRIKDLKVAVDVDSDLILKGKKATVNYGGKKDTAITASAAQESFTSGRLDNIIGGIGNYTQLTKTASNLSKNETYTVKGEYSANWFRLYLSSIIITILTVVGVIAVIYLLSRYLKQRKSGKKSNKRLAELEVESPVHLTGQELSNLSVSDSPVKTIDVKLDLTKVAICGLVSALSVIVIYIMCELISSYGILNQSGGYNSVLSLIFSLIAILILILGCFGLAVYLSVKRGWKYLIPVIIAEILWFIIFAILYSVAFSSGLTNMFKNPTYPTMTD